MRRLMLYQDCLRLCLGGFGLFGSLSLFFCFRWGIGFQRGLLLKETEESVKMKVGKTEILSEFFVEQEILIAHGNEPI